MEAAERQAKQIENDSRSEHVHTLEDHHHVPGKGKRGCCYRCGIEGHFARDPECKARSVTCSKCTKIGHLAKCCRTKVENNTKRGNVHQISEDDFAFSVQSDIRDIPTIDIELGGIQLEGVLVDSGSTCNVIDRETWETLKRKNIKCRSWKSNRKLYSYGSEEPLNTAEGVSYKRNVTELKKYLTGSEELDQQDTGQNVVTDRNANTGTPEVFTRPARLRKPPGYLKDYEFRRL
ncbi:hypothetical protein P5673_030103 [Acropora cervicornis]|uniref:CCHC-type domain-containing protein n=1 Tax=Acropora cervicornis TaxID=6130 RepID=A0AAD9PUZ1_ACRCE|nr:hypothetical protein P5673_030103 [Acropora cervicornis]